MKMSQRLTGFFERVRAIPLYAYPRIITYWLRRQWAVRIASVTPSALSDADLLRAFDAISISQLLADFQKRESPCFFWGDDPRGRASEVAAASPGLEARLRARGETILAHRFDLLGSGPTDLGCKIPWRRDFISGYEWPLQHFTRLTLVDLDTGCDIKVPWELSRFYHAPALGQCYALTSDEQYAEEFVAQLTDWWAENPSEVGPNWANAMEAAFRSANWIWSYELLRGSAALDDGFVVALLKSLLQHGRYIARRMEEGWPGSNHLIADLCGLIWLGAFLSPVPEAGVWLRKGLRLLTRELRVQINPDGSDYEGSTSYHLLVTEMVLWTVAYCRRACLRRDLNSVIVPQTILERLSDMLDVIAGLLRPDGNLPLFGDCDSGRWLALESDTDQLLTVQDPLGVLALGSVLFEREDWAALAGNRWEAALWAFGQRAAVMCADSQPSSPSPQPALALPDAGWYVMRQGDHYLAVTAGGNGTLGWGGHSHNDALSFELAVGERVFLVDSGSYAYTGDYRARNAFRGTAAHNTVRVNGQEISRIPERDMFRLEDDARVTVSEWHTCEQQIWLDTECISTRGWRKLYMHRRRFEYHRQPGFWFITDIIRSFPGYRHSAICPARDWPAPSRTSAGGICDNLRTIQFCFHFAPLPVALDGLAAYTLCESGQNLALFPVGAAEASLSVTLESGWISSRYGVRVKVPVVRYSYVGDRVDEVRFVLVPLDGCFEFRRVRDSVISAV